jgi:hypothetical protein
MIEAGENKMEGLQPIEDIHSKEKSDFIRVNCFFWFKGSFRRSAIFCTLSRP